MIIWEAFSDDHNLHLGLLHSLCPTLRSHNTENSKQIFPGKELHGYSPNSYIHVSVSDLYIPLTDLPILLQEIVGPRGLQRDVVCLCCPIAPSYTSPNAGGVGGGCGVSANEYSCEHHVTGDQINSGDQPPYLTYGWAERGNI
jgi:hypothetical protein